jgi:hypothetical protein
MLPRGFLMMLLLIVGKDVSVREVAPEAKLRSLAAASGLITIFAKLDLLGSLSATRAFLTIVMPGLV